MFRGCYHQTLGDVLENLWAARGPTVYLDRALIEYAAASSTFEQAEHRSYLANVENNLGFLLYKVNHCEEAHEHLDSARRIFNSLKDKSDYPARARMMTKLTNMKVDHSRLIILHEDALNEME